MTPIILILLADAMLIFAWWLMFDPDKQQPARPDPPKPAPFVQAVLVKTQRDGQPDQVFILRTTRERIFEAIDRLTHWTLDPRLDFTVADGMRMAGALGELAQDGGTEAEDAAATAGCSRRTGTENGV